MLLSFERFSCGEGHAGAAASLRTANENITRVTPLIIMLTPTNVPIAQTKTRPCTPCCRMGSLLSRQTHRWRDFECNRLGFIS